MSEATTAAVAPAESPATTGTDQQTPAPAPAAAPTQHQSPKQAAREAALSRFRGADSAAASEPAPAAQQDGAAPAPSEPVVDASGRTHDPATGRFLPNGGQDPSAVPAEASAEDRPAFVRIELPEGHPLRERGRTHIDAPAAEEQDYRALVNASARRAEVEQYRQEIARMQDELLRTQAQAEARQKFAGDVLADPARMEVYQAVASVDPAAAEAMKRGWEQEADAEAQKLYGEKSAELQKHEAVQAATAFLQQAEQAALEYLPPELRGHPQMRTHYDRARFQYGNHLEYLEQIGQPKAPDTREFLEVFRREILTDPTVQQWAEQRMEAKRQAEAEQIAAKAKADAEAAAAAAEQQRLQDAAQRHSTRHPFGQVPGNVRTDRATVSTEQDMSNVPAHQRKRAIKQQLFGPNAR